MLIIGLPGIAYNSRPAVAGLRSQAAPRGLTYWSNIAAVFDSLRNRSSSVALIPSFALLIIGLPGIEPGLHEPESCVLPAYASPLFCEQL